MQYASIFHRASENWCYPIDENTIEIKIKTGYDIQNVSIIHGDPFESGILGGNWKWNGTKLEINEVYELQYHKLWVVRITPPYKRLKYYFELQTDKSTMLYFEDGFLTHEQAGIDGKALQCFTMPWLNAIDVKTTPEWVSSTIWYQIFPDRFARADFDRNPNALKWGSRKPRNEDVYGGDLEGIISRLDYLKDLGVSGIYLNPIFTAGSTHKYDTIDYYEIDPMFGDKATFKRMVEECHHRGIRVMLDGVFNHSGRDFAPWLDVIEKGSESKYFDWFMVNQWPFDTSKHHTKDNEFYSFAFTTMMPKLNTNNPEVINYVSEICEYWIQEFDIDGWRLDVANEISHALCKEIQKRCRAIKPDIYILGEIWHDSINWLRGDEFDSVMNYPLTTAINDYWFNTSLTSKNFEHSVNNCYHRYMHQTNKALFNMLDSHDTDRLYHRVNQNANIYYQQFALMFTMSGSLSLYYGTEIMLDGAHDPGCRACMPWNEIDSGKHTDVLTQMKRLIEIRNQYDACLSQQIQFEYHHNDRVIEYVKDQQLRVVVNASNQTIEIKPEEILFSNGLEGTQLSPEGVVITKIK